MSETGTVIPEILKAVTRLGTRLFRNQVGSYELADGRRLSSGLCVGSSDLIGWTPVTITAEMVGQKVAVFTAIEAKKGRRQATEEQDRFIAAVQRAGGIAGVARSAEDAVGLIDPASRLL